MSVHLNRAGRRRARVGGMVLQGRASSCEEIQRGHLKPRRLLCHQKEEEKGTFHVSWGVVPFNKHSAEGEDPGECLSHNLRLLHVFTGRRRSEMGLIVFLCCP